MRRLLNLSEGQVTARGTNARARRIFRAQKSSRQETVMDPPPPPSRDEAPAQAEKRPLDAAAAEAETAETAAKKQRLADTTVSSRFSLSRV